MYVDADFSSAKVGQAAAECVDREALVRYLPVACCKDVVVYAADEDGRLDDLVRCLCYDGEINDFTLRMTLGPITFPIFGTYQ